MNSNIKWKKDSDGDISATIGAINMHCRELCGYDRRTEYRASVSVRHLYGTSRCGVWRLSKEKAKEDAVRLVHELLQDLDMGLTSAIKTFEKATKIEVRV